MGSAVAITGNTYPVKDKIKALGGRWNADAHAWMVPAEKAGVARALVAGTPARRSYVFRGSNKRRTYSCRTCRDMHDGGTICPDCGQED